MRSLIFLNYIFFASILHVLKYIKYVKKFNFFIVFVAIIFLSFSCSSNKLKKIEKPTAVIEVDKLYNIASDNFENGNYKDSLSQFLKIYSTYGFTEYAPRALLMASYIYYNNGSYYDSLEILQKFRKLYPSHQNMDYVDYMTALCAYEQIEQTSKDQTNTLLALKTFDRIKEKYPKSKYIEDINLKIDLINDQLAGKEMYIARFYMERNKWLAAIMRLNNVVKNYENTVYIEEALHRLVEVHYKTGNIDTAKKYASILGYNFNNSDWYRKSYKNINSEESFLRTQKQKKTFKEKIKSLIN